MRRSTPCGPTTSGDIVDSFYPKRYVYLEPQTSFDFFFSGEAGTKSPLLASSATASTIRAWRR